MQHIGREPFSSTVLGSLVRSENSTDKDRLTGEKHIYLFNIWKFNKTQTRMIIKK